ncbi:hypothetical protein AB0O28_21530 [Microbispora sp. NPDC088329]|uniref:hypothetical protein n=1 Tax=Microbispora sp. NPDC088329 TaxID=3154869 RepID=UPI00343F5B74
MSAIRLRSQLWRSWPSVNIGCVAIDPGSADDAVELDLVTADGLSRILGHHPLGKTPGAPPDHGVFSRG